MTPATIAIPVDSDMARAFADATPTERRKLELLLRLRLRELTVDPSRPLGQIIDEIGRDAAARGLTPDLLELLLRDD